MPPNLLRTCVAALLLPATILPVAASSFSFIALGDMPYNEAQTEAFTRSIAQINALNAEFVLHVGDIKGGGTPCDDAVFAHRAKLYGQSALPFVVLIGDNEFNDCTKPMEALGLFRKHFCANNQSIGLRTIPLERQPAIQPEHAYPEQIRWSHEGVHFLGLNVVGSNNHFGAPEEWEARTKAGVAWLTAGFAHAAAESAPAIVVAIHANPFAGNTYPEAFAPIMNALEEEAAAFAKPVLLMHGDTHYFRWDIPFKAKAGKGVATNLSRLEVFGAPNPHWVEVMVDPASAQVFAIRPHFLEEKK